MYELNGLYNNAKIFSNKHDEKSDLQIIELLNQKWMENIKIRIMPDFHSGVGCVIGTTIQIKDKIVPNLVGVDIGCGMYVVDMGKININLEKLDKYINKHIPSGQNINSKQIVSFSKINDLKCINKINKDRALKSIGTLGGGNHFIEIDKSKNGNVLLIIHSGSRYLGKQVALYYQENAYKKCIYKDLKILETIKQLKHEHRESEIEDTLIELKKSSSKITKHLSYLENEDFDNYMHDMKIVQNYASLNRKTIANKILKYLKIDSESSFETIHNYIDIENMILRKGAISANKDEICIIPMNMRDGCLLCKGKGNEDWNCSAPHGAGRIMSRTKAKENITLSNFEKSMQNIYSSSVVSSTIDESPMAYKPMDEIIENIKETVTILENIKPIYNFKNKDIKIRR